MAIPNPMKSLPWNVKKEKEREARRLKAESAKLHRELGIAEDATFEEIQEATQALIAKAEADGDPKKKIKIEIAKDKIMQIRLNERLAGVAHVTEDAAAQSAAEAGSFDDDMEDIKDDIGKATPSFFDGLIKKPDEAHKKNQIKTWGLLTLLCFVIPPIAQQVGFVNWIFAGTQIMNRGVDDSDRFEGESMTKNKAKTKSMFIAFSIWLATKIVFGFLASFFPSLQTAKMAPAVETTIINFALGTATCYVSTYKP